ncbi:MAG: hypothetical protein QM766_14000 [Burkholderiaceae bacterium]
METSIEQHPILDDDALAGLQAGQHFDAIADGRFHADHARLEVERGLLDEDSRKETALQQRGRGHQQRRM